MAHPRSATALALAIAALSPDAFAQFTVNGGLEYTTGDYGKRSATDEWRIPLGAAYRAGAWNFRLSAPLSRVSGVASALERELGVPEDDEAALVPTLDDDVPSGGGGVVIDRGPGGGAGGGNGDDDDDDDDDANPSAAGAQQFVAGAAASPASASSTLAQSSMASTGGVRRTVRSRTQSGFSDVFLSAFYTFLDPDTAPVGFDLGARIKVPVVSGSRCLLTNGEIDYSVQANIYKPLGRFEPYASLGWTKRGDPPRRDSNCNAIPGETIDLRDPVFFVVGLGMRLSDATFARVEYEFREKLLPTADPRSEARLGLTHQLGQSWRVGAYGLAGFTDASPDWGLGATVSYRF